MTKPDCPKCTADGAMLQPYGGKDAAGHQWHECGCCNAVLLLDAAGTVLRVAGATPSER